MFAKRRLLESVGGFDGKLRFAADLNQYYDLERRFRPSMRLLRSCVAIMKPGGAANSGPGAALRGSIEIYRHLRPVYGSARAAAMVFVKTLQSCGELRYGTTGHERWFSRHCQAAE